MNSFSLLLHDATQARQIDRVCTFVGEDASGSFGLLAGHSRFMTTLVIGLARFRTLDGDWQYLALPGGVLYFNDNRLTISTHRYLLDDDYLRISDALQQQLLSEEAKLHSIKESLHRMEDEVLRRLWELGRRERG